MLFSYLLILNAGLLIIAYNKNLRLLNALAFGFTAILFTSWLIDLSTAATGSPYSTGSPDSTGSAYTGGFLFATAFYILFFVINIAHNIRENKRFIASDFGILLANTSLYFAAGLYLLAQMQLTRYEGLFSATISIFNLLCSYSLFRTKKVDNNILYLLIGITLSFVSLTAPIQLHGHYITLFWASESVLLYWLYQKSQIRIIRLASFGIWVAMLVSLIMDWADVYGPIYTGFTAPEPIGLPILLNKGFLTGLYAAACCFALFRLSRGKPLAKVFWLTGGVLLYIGSALEIYYQFNYYYPGTDWSLVYLFCSLPMPSCSASLFSLGRVKDADLYPLNACLLAGCWVLYLTFIPAGFAIWKGRANHIYPDRPITLSLIGPAPSCSRRSCTA